MDNKEVEFVVYNPIDCKARIVKVIPNSQWGGEGVLGCSILNGALIKIP